MYVCITIFIIDGGDLGFLDKRLTFLLLNFDTKTLGERFQTLFVDDCLEFSKKKKTQ